ncbi:hypothetical protein H4683_001958 [Filibacter limicola]|uniref:Uncharacterized protein n=1 Tax=Sporosarcina limicola TaxID=34101 RepID=A0A927RCZ7_9BACL|nr:hypothetical protein [Sporosarcina limicola]
MLLYLGFFNITSTEIRIVFVYRVFITFYESRQIMN